MCRQGRVKPPCRSRGDGASAAGHGGHAPRGIEHPRTHHRHRHGLLCHPPVGDHGPFGPGRGSGYLVIGPQRAALTSRPLPVPHPDPPMGLLATRAPQAALRLCLHSLPRSKITIMANLSQQDLRPPPAPRELWSRTPRTRCCPRATPRPTYCRCRSISVVLLPPTQFSASRGFGVSCKSLLRRFPNFRAPFEDETMVLERTTALNLKTGAARSYMAKNL